MHPKTWKASGHVDAFMDPLIDNKDSKKRYRADVLIEDYLGKLDDKIDKEIEKAAKRFGNAFDEGVFRSTNERVLKYAEERKISLPAEIRDWPLNAEIQKLYKTEIDGLVNSYRAKVSRLLENEALLQLASNVEVAVALADSAANAQLSAEQAASAAKQLIPFSVDLDWGPLLIAHYLYDDPNRADEIVALNPPTDFFYPKGTILRVPDR
jgi:prophage DNA circulation protein